MENIALKIYTNCSSNIFIWLKVFHQMQDI